MIEVIAMARISDMHKKWMKEPKYRKAYEALEEEFVLASALIDARNRAGLTQEELARKMGTTQPVVARLESGRTRPSMRTLERLAEAIGSRLLISFERRDAKRSTSGAPPSALGFDSVGRIRKKG
jgi:ribosome-binding protein aMBF1 (putative translation factor)